MDRRKVVAAFLALTAAFVGAYLTLDAPSKATFYAVCGAMGFGINEGFDIETDWFNFGALNIPGHHPARADHDTFYLPGERDGRPLVMRTQTSDVQIITMLLRG